MDLTDRFITMLRYVLALNVITALFKYWPRKKNINTYKSSEKKESSWSWKDTIWLIIMISATLLICILPFLLPTYKNLKLGSWILGIIVVSYYLKHFSELIPSARTIKQIVTGNTVGTLNIYENNSIVLIAFITIMLNNFHIRERILNYALICNSSILGDCIIAVMTILLIIICGFFICALSVGPLQFLLSIAKRFFMRIPTQQIKKSEPRIKQHIFGDMSTNTLTVSLIEFTKKRVLILKILLYPIVLLTAILDIVYRSLSLFFHTIISILWYSYQIVQQIIMLFIKMCNRILLLSDKTVVAISFRFAIILGFGLTVALNRYAPFFRNQEESTAVLEFLSSTIIIPVILEWILSYKKRDNS